MKLGIVRQRYTPFGGAERFVERAMEALPARGVGLRVYTRRWPASPRRRRSSRSSATRSTSATAGATRASPARSRPRSRGIAPTSCRPTSASTAATSSAPATASTASGWRSGCAPAARSSGSRIAANGYHRYILDAEARVFADPELKAVICISQMVKDDIRAHFDDRRRASCTSSTTPSTRREFGPQLRDAPRGDARAATASPTSDVSSCWSARATRARACPRRSGARAAARRRAPRRRRPRQARRSLPGAGARASGVADRVLFAGPQVDPKPWYGAADAFVLPTLYDPLSNAVLEALACGLPVVTSTRCGAGERVREFGAGDRLRRRRHRRHRRRHARADGRRHAGRPRAARDGRGRRAHPGGDERAAARTLRLAAVGPARRRDYNRDLPCGAAVTPARREAPPCAASPDSTRIAPDARAALPAMTRLARASRARRRRLPLRRPGRARPPPAVGDRPRRQPAAAGRAPTAAWRSSSTARSTTSARCAPSSRPPATASRTARRRRSDRSPAGSSGGAGVARPARRHVRLRALGPRAAGAVSRPRPPGREAALLRVARRIARLRLGAEGAAAVSAACRARSTSTR